MESRNFLVQPDSVSAAYGDHARIQELRFTLPDSGFVAGDSIRLEGRIGILTQAGGATVVKPATADIANQTVTWMSPSAGVNGVIASVVVQDGQGRIIEDISAYPRVASVRGYSALSLPEKSATTRIHTDLAGGNEIIATAIAAGSNTEAHRRGFSIKLMSGLLARKLVSCERGLKIIVRLETNQRALSSILYGTSANTVPYYEIVGAQITGVHVIQPIAPPSGLMLFESLRTVKMVIRGAMDSLSIRMPATVMAVAVNFLSSANSGNVLADETALEVLPGLSRVRLTLGGALLPLKYELEVPVNDVSRNNILAIFREVYGVTAPRASRDAARGNFEPALLQVVDHMGERNLPVFGAAMRFDRPMELAGIPVAFEFRSEVVATDPYLAFATFKTLEAIEI